MTEFRYQSDWRLNLTTGQIVNADNLPVGNGTVLRILEQQAREIERLRGAMEASEHHLEGHAVLLNDFASHVQEAKRERDECRRLLRMVYAKAVRNKYNLSWHEITLKDDEMADVLKAAGGVE